MTRYVRLPLRTAQAVLHRFQRVGGPLLLAALALGAATLTGLVEDVSAAASVVSIVVFAIAVLLLVVVWLRWRQTVHILPFRNSAGPDAQPQLEALAAGLSEQVDFELRRIRRLRGAGEASLIRDLYPDDGGAARAFNSTDARSHAGDRTPWAGKGQIRKQQTRKLRPLQAGREADHSSAPESATLAVGGLRLPLDWLMGIVSRSAAKAIRGSVFTAGDQIVAVADSHAGARWQAVCPLDREPAKRLPALARDLAAQMAWYLDEAEPGEGDHTALAGAVEGMAHFERWQTTSSPTALERAEATLTDVVTRHPRFAFAYSCLGVVLGEQVRLGRAGHAAAAAMWERAARLNPRSPDIALRLALEDLRLGDTAAAERRCREALDRYEQAGRPTSLARYVLADALFHRAELALAEEHPGVHHAGDGLGEALEQLARAERELHAIRRNERIAGAAPEDLGDLDADLALVALAQAHVHEWRTRHGLDHGDAFVAAANACQRAVEARPHQAEYRADLAVASARAGQRREAVAEAALALRIDPWAPRARHALALALAAGDGDDPDQAFEVALSALDVQPWDPAEWRLAAQLALWNGLPDCAVELAGCALALAPDDAATHGLLADACGRTRLDDWEEAFRTIGERLPGPMRDPADAPGGAVDLAARWTDAWTRRDRATVAALAPDLLPCSLLAANEIGRLHLTPGTVDAGVEWLRQAVRGYAGSACSARHPLPVEWLLDLGDAHLMAQRWDDARCVYRKVLRRHERDTGLAVELPEYLWVRPESWAPAIAAAARAGLGGAAMGKGDAERALEESAEAVRLEPCLAYPYATMAEAMHGEGRFDEAVAHWGTFARLAPDRITRADAGIGDARYQQALAEAASSRRSELLEAAAEAYRRASTGDRQFVLEPWLHANLAVCLMELGNDDAALRRLRLAEQAAGGDPQWRPVALDVADGYVRLGHVTEAIELLRRTAALASATADGATGEAEHARAAAVAAEACNALAWLLVDHDRSLPEAQRTAREAVTRAGAARSGSQDVDADALLANALDTLGWVQHKLGDDAAAAETLERSLALDPRCSVRAHLADVLESRADGHNGASDAEVLRRLARRQWQRISELEPDSRLGVRAARKLGESRQPGPPAPAPPVLDGGG